MAQRPGPPRPHNLAASKLFNILVHTTSCRHFLVLPDPFLYPHYYAFIPRPVCMADIAAFIASPERRYALADMTRDVRRIIANAKKFNLPSSVVYADALQLEVRGVRGGGGGGGGTGALHEGCRLADETVWGVRVRVCLQRIMRRAAKDIERDGEAFDDEEEV
jgi:hypothetical protein